MILEELKKYVSYNKSTGILTAKKDISIRTKKGDKLGGIDNSTGYLQVRLFGKKYRVHRVIMFYMTGRWVKCVDHINRKKTDNRWCNLREVTHSENSINKDGYGNTKILGVHKSNNKNQRKKFLARIVVNGKSKHLGSFKTLKEAIRVRKDAENKYYRIGEKK